MNISEVISRSSLGGLNERFLINLTSDSTIIRAKSNSNSFLSIVTGPPYLSGGVSDEIEVPVVNAGDLEKLLGLVDSCSVEPVVESGSVRELLFTTDSGKKLRFTVGGALDLEENTFQVANSGTEVMLSMVVSGAVMEDLKKASGVLKSSDLTLYVNEDEDLIGRVGHSDSNYFETVMSEDSVEFNEPNDQYRAVFNAKPLFAANKYNKKGSYEFFFYPNQLHVVVSSTDKEGNEDFRADYILTRVR